jgi:hypothetical protein
LSRAARHVYALNKETGADSSQAGGRKKGQTLTLADGGAVVAEPRSDAAVGLCEAEAHASSGQAVSAGLAVLPVVEGIVVSLLAGLGHTGVVAVTVDCHTGQGAGEAIGETVGGIGPVKGRLGVSLVVDGNHV